MRSLDGLVMAVSSTPISDVSLGGFSLRDGSYEHLLLGTHLHDIDADLKANEEALEFELNATDGYEGQLLLAGATTLAAPLAHAGR